MPPRKSEAAKAPVVTGDEATPSKDLPLREGINIEDLNLPKSIVTRLAKGVLPPNTQIHANAMLAMSKSATVFVNYVATNANESATSQNRKTIAPQDVMKALENTEFAEFIPRLEAELAKFTEMQSEKRSIYRRSLKAAGGAGEASNSEAHDADADEAELGAHDTSPSPHKNGQPASKRARRNTNNSEEHGGDIRDVENQEDADIEEDDEPEEEDEEAEERFEVEEQERERDGDADADGDERDEALDNGEDSD